MSDALWDLLASSGAELSRTLIFLPSRRAVRTVEKTLAQKSGGAIILPHLVALGEGLDDPEFISDTDATAVPNMARYVMLAKLLSADASIGSVAAALPVAHDLVRMTDYLENEGVDASAIDWNALVGDAYARHFQRKANLLNILTRTLPACFAARPTQTAARNADIRGWGDALDKYELVVVCASTASVPATADLMRAVAVRENGRVILSGKIMGAPDDLSRDTNPYNAEYKFLLSLGMTPGDVQPIDVGPSPIDFLNYAFGNNPARSDNGTAISHCHLIECARESEEAAVIAEIAARAVSENKSVLVITPDAAGNQRVAQALATRGIDADFSGGVPGSMTPAGRAILNVFDDWIERGDGVTFDKMYAASHGNLMETIIRMVDENRDMFAPMFDVSDAASLQIWSAIQNISECMRDAEIVPTVADARAFLADAISSVTVRGVANDTARVVVLGTIESRMQTADVVILSALNEGMFPARGYENAWLPTRIARQIGLPSADRKVSLQSLDFMNLSCGSDVYWTRSRVSGGVQTTESRFLSRVVVRGGAFDRTAADDILNAVRGRDVVPARPLDYRAPMPPADWSDVYVTELETLIHNPYAFYARHILRLQPCDDYWLPPDARAFGMLVHAALEDIKPGKTVAALVADMDARARAVLGGDSIIFHFWHKRFMEIAPVAIEYLMACPDAEIETGGVVNIAGRNVRARADRVWDGGVLDIKTGIAPNKSQLAQGNMPQLPLEAYMLQSGGFKVRTTEKSKTPVMVFLQLKNGDVRPIEYDAATTAEMIAAAVEKTTDLVNMYSAGGAPYEYRETGDKKYQAWDDLARKND